MTDHERGEQAGWAQAIERAVEIVGDLPEIVAELRSLQPNPNWLRDHDREVAAKARLEAFKDIKDAYLTDDSAGRAGFMEWLIEGIVRLETEREAPSQGSGQGERK
jgi:hypothetical protein